MCLSDLERIEDMYPWLNFYMIDVPNVHYHGHVQGYDVYLNENQSNEDWLRTALHEATHAEVDYDDLTNAQEFKTMKAEGFAVAESKRMFNRLFGKYPNTDDIKS